MYVDEIQLLQGLAEKSWEPLPQSSVTEISSEATDYTHSETILKALNVMSMLNVKIPLRLFEYPGWTAVVRSLAGTGLFLLATTSDPAKGNRSRY
jgi:hypothetical protein